MKRFIAVILLLSSLLLAISPAHADTDPGLEEIRIMMQAGASQLALKMLDAHQPDIQDQPQRWIQWEQQRIEMYRFSRNWDALIKRLDQLPLSLPVAFLRWASEQRVYAWSEKGDYEQALATLRGMIWNTSNMLPEDKPEELLARWRRMVIQVYLAAGKVRDAEIAMLRYQQDYGNAGLQWNLLRARVLIRAQRPSEAAQLLRREKSVHARPLYYLAQLRAGKPAPQKIYADSVALAKQKKIPDSVRRESWQVAAFAAQQVKDYPAAIRMFRHALEVADHDGYPSEQDRLFALSGTQLWRIYQEYGHLLGNQMQLLIGSDRDWFLAADKLIKKKPLEAASLFAVLARESQSIKTRKLAHEEFAGLYLQHKNGIVLLRQLYRLDENDKLLADLPDSLRHRMVDDALARSDIALASKLMGDLAQPPKNVDPLFWQLRRARILVMGGKADDGIAALNALLESKASYTRPQMDRFMQVLFDIQAIHRHADAIRLFRKIPAGEYDLQFQREVLYWIADSQRALKQPVEAARNYLRSATLPGEEVMDPWAQTARYHAAESLAEAGLTEDAGRIYRHLLRVTKDPGRRVVLRNKLQQLWLKPVQDKANGENQGAS